MTPERIECVTVDGSGGSSPRPPFPTVRIQCGFVVDEVFLERKDQRLIIVGFRQNGHRNVRETETKDYKPLPLLKVLHSRVLIFTRSMDNGQSNVREEPSVLSSILDHVPSTVGPVLFSPLIRSVGRLLSSEDVRE